MTQPTPQILLEPLAVALGQDFLGHEEHWRVAVLLRNGRSLIKQQIEEMDRESKIKLLANLKVVAGSEKVRNTNTARPWRSGSNVWEVKAKSWRVMFFYMHKRRSIVLTN